MFPTLPGSVRLQDLQATPQFKSCSAETKAKWEPLLTQCNSVKRSKRKYSDLAGQARLVTITPKAFDASLSTWETQSPPLEARVFIFEQVAPFAKPGNQQNQQIQQNQVDQYNQVNYIDPVDYADHAKYVQSEQRRIVDHVDRDITVASPGLLRSKFARPLCSAFALVGRTSDLYNIIFVSEDPFGQDSVKFIREFYGRQQLVNLVLLPVPLSKFLTKYPRWARKAGYFDTVNTSVASVRLDYYVDMEPWDNDAQKIASDITSAPADQAFIQSMHTFEEKGNDHTLRTAIAQEFFKQDGVSFFALQQVLRTRDLAGMFRGFYSFMPMDLVHDAEPTLVYSNLQAGHGKLFVGGQHHLHPRSLRREKISGILTIGAPQFNDALRALDAKNLVHENGLKLEFCEVVLNDDGRSSCLEFLEKCVSFVISQLEQGFNVIVHCHRGMSRSATVTIACLMKILHIPFYEAYNILAKVREKICPNPRFQYDLLHFEFSILAKRETMTVINE